MDASDKKRVDKLFKNLSYKNKIFFNSQTIDSFIAHLDSIPETEGYTYISDDIKILWSAIEQAGDEISFADFNKCILLRLIEQFLERTEKSEYKLPESITRQFHINFQVEITNIKGLRALFRLVPYLIRLWKLAGETDVFHVMAISGWSWQLFSAPAVWIAWLRNKRVTRNLEPIYGIQTAIKAVSLLHESIAGIKLTIAGSGPQKKRSGRFGKSSRNGGYCHIYRQTEPQRYCRAISNCRYYA